MKFHDLFDTRIRWQKNDNQERFFQGTVQKEYEQLKW